MDHRWENKNCIHIFIAQLMKRSHGRWRYRCGEWTSEEKAMQICPEVTLAQHSSSVASFLVTVINLCSTQKKFWWIKFEVFMVAKMYTVFWVWVWDYMMSQTRRLQSKFVNSSVTTSWLCWALSVAVFLKLPATADHYMGSQCTCGPLSYRNIPFSYKEHAIVLYLANRWKIIVKVAINYFFLSTNFK
jgi:hypothetical protein